MALSCKLATSQTFDAVAYARSMLEDDSASPTITDARFRWYIETVAEDFSRHLPLDMPLVGNPTAGTSPLNTVSGQQRYVCSVANGFSLPPSRIISVQGITSGLNAINDTAMYFLNPYSTVQGFLAPAAIDSPSQRIIRDSYLAELDAYSQTFYDLRRDPTTGLPAIDLYPIPQATGPVYVRYQAQHADSGTPGTASIYLTIPEEHKRNFGDLLYAQVLFEEAGRLALRGRVKAGQIEREATAADMRILAIETRERVYTELGGTAPVAIAG